MHSPASKLKNQQITISPVAGNAKWLEQVIEWSQIQSAGLMPAGEDEQNDIRQNRQDFYIIEYGTGIFKQPVGTFKLYDHSIPGVKSLDYFYIIDEMRGQGIGGLVLQKIKNIAQKQGAELIVFDTITPRLNAFYERNGAKVVCDNWFNEYGKTNTHPSTLMRMDV